MVQYLTNQKCSYEEDKTKMETQRLIDSFFTVVKNKDISALADIFTSDAVYVARNGATYCGFPQILEHFKTMFFEGKVRAWDIRRIIEEGAVEWYYEYRYNFAGSISFDGVSLYEISDGKIKRWRDFIQAVNKTYPLESHDVELLQTASRIEVCADWIDTLAMHDERFRSAAEKLQNALSDLVLLLPNQCFSGDPSFADDNSQS